MDLEAQNLAMKDKTLVNNAIYDELGDAWYLAEDDPVALLRAESGLKAHWILQNLETTEFKKGLDVGCGAGFVCNRIGANGYQMIGVDQSKGSLDQARKAVLGATDQVSYCEANAYALDFEESSFDFVVSTDFLEHVSEPHRVIGEISRVLKPGGRFYFQTFNRNFMAWLIVIKGLEWFVEKTPKNLHTLNLFLKPKEVFEMCQRAGMRKGQLVGMRPKINRAFFEMLWTRKVPKDFEFRLSSSKIISYMGWVEKQ